MENLKKSIDTYIAEDNPCYALQITGEWGVGKTFTIKNILKDDMYYISVFGLEKIEDVYSSIFYTMHKNKTNKAARNISNLVKDVKFSFQGLNIPLGLGADFLIKSIIKDRIKNDKVIVIDDIERSSIGSNEIFGFISNCLENHKCKIILLMNENIMDQNNHLLEKTIGRKLTITANFEDAYDEFIKPHISKKTLKILKLDIIDIFKRMNCQSLRILKRLLFELDMILKCIDDKKFIKLQDEFKSNLTVFSALSIFIKQGRIEAKYLIERKHSLSYYFLSEKERNEEGKHAEEFAKLYKELGDDINLTSDFLNDDTLISILANGFFTPLEINKSIHEYLGNKKEDITPWLVIYKYYQYDDQKINDAILQTDSIISNKSNCELGNLLHLISAIYYVKELYCEVLKIDDLNKYIFKYIDYLYKNTDCFLNNGSNVWFNHIYDNSHGFAYASSENGEFKNIIEIIKEKVDSYSIEKTQDIGYKLNQLFIEDTESFFTFINKYFKKNTIYTNRPILKNINQDRFAHKAITLSYFDYHRLYDFFYNRYGQGQLYNDLKDEKLWVEKLILYIKEKNKENKNTLSKLRVDNFASRLIHIIR